MPPTAKTMRADPPTPGPTAGGRWEAELGTVRVCFGNGRLAELGEAARDLGASRVLLVTDPGLVAAGHAAAAETALRAAGLAVAAYSEVPANPTSEDVERGAARAAAHRPDLIVALGGGSAMDFAKGINFLHTNGGRMADYRGLQRPARPLLASIGVPTTAGTGSDAQSYALISDPATHRKMACGSPQARFRTVLLDPRLLLTAPRRVAAAAALDALSHAVESAVTRRRNPLSDLYAREAWRLLEGACERALAATGRSENETQGTESWSAMLLGAHLAGAAIEQSMLGAAHACANPLTARFGVIHGEAVALMLPHVVRFNAAAGEDGYAALARTAGLEGIPAEAVAGRLEALREAAGLPSRLSDCGVERPDLTRLAADATEEWTGRFNPRPVTEDDLESLYESAF